jgi:hypothetical protein
VLALVGRPIRIEVRRSLGGQWAATSIPRRLILLDSEVLRTRGEFERILVHEIFHFVWRRLSNASRRSWEAVMKAEYEGNVGGELGWSAELRKRQLTGADLARRTPAWRRYACESFCDSAAWLYSRVVRHEEFTLPAWARRRRRRWFADKFPASFEIPI